MQIRVALYFTDEILEILLLIFAVFLTIYHREDSLANASYNWTHTFLKKGETSNLWHYNFVNFCKQQVNKKETKWKEEHRVQKNRH